MVELVKSKKKGLLDTYFSEIMSLPQVKKIDWKKYKFKIMLGGKGRGKSGLAFQELLDHIEKFEPVIYMRNTLEEIKNMKPMLLEMIQKRLGDKVAKYTCTDEAITGDGKVLVVFVSTKNYNKISGNLNPFFMVFYDEFNQILKTDTAKMVDDFFNICQTIFRHREGNIGACGNTKTANNILFNLLKIEPYLPEDLLNISAEKDYYIITTYKPELFKHGVADDSTLDMMKDLNPTQYKTMMEGDEFAVSSELVLNKEPPDLDKGKKLDYVGVMDTKMYGTYENNTMGYLKPMDVLPSERSITDLVNDGYSCITLNKQGGLGTSPCTLSNDSQPTSILDYKLKHGDCFFGDYYLYTYLSTVWGWRYVSPDFILH